MALRQQLSVLGSRVGREALLRPATVAASSRRPRKERPALSIHSRNFHPSGKKEMLPVIGGALAVAAVATGLRYLIRAGRRMQEMEAEKSKGGTGSPAGPEGGVPTAAVPTGSGNVGPTDGPAFGIDVGVTNLRLAFSDSAEKQPEIVENREGSRWTPAALAFKEMTDPVIGGLARAQRYEAAATTLAGMQPLLGLQFADPSWGDVASSSGAAGGGVFEGREGFVGLRVGGEGGAVLTAEEAVGLMLGNMKSLGEHKVASGGGAVLSCPGYFTDAQRDAMAGAGERAGIAVLDVIEEPVAAVLAARGMSLLPKEGARGLVAVLDVGGRTTQCSIVDSAVDDGKLPKLVGSDWTMECGGEQMDAVLVDSLNTEFKRNNGGMSLTGDMMALTRLYDAATAARIELSRVQQAHVNLPYITADQTGPKHLDVAMSRARMDILVEPLLKKAEAPCRSALSLAGVDASALSAVLVIGGCCRTPAIQELARRLFVEGGAGIVSPEQSEEMVVLGTALEARRLMFES